MRNNLGRFVNIPSTRPISVCVFQKKRAWRRSGSEPGMEVAVLKENKWQIIKRFLSDAIIIGAGGIVLLMFKLFGTPYQRGFFCDDETLQHPFKDSTVTSGMLYGIGFALAIVLIIIVEVMRVNCLESDIDTRLYGKLIVIGRNIYISLVPFMFGAVVEHITADIGKYSVGRLRPHFFSACNINVASLNCSAGYIEDFECNSDSAYKFKEARLSFPSGHSSFSSYVAVYMIIYLQKRLTLQLQTLIRPAVQMGLFSLAWYTCLSRISDYKHHPTDVLAGAIIGTVAAVLVACGVSSLFDEPTEKMRKDILTNYGTANITREEQTATSIATKL